MLLQGEWCPFGCRALYPSRTWVMVVDGETEPAGYYCSRACAVADMVGPRFRAANAVRLTDWLERSVTDDSAVGA